VLEMYIEKYHPLLLRITGTDLSAATEITMTAKRDARSDATLFQKTMTGGGIVVVSSTEATVHIEEADTTGAAPGTYKYDVCVEESPGRERVAIPPTPFELLLPIC